MRFTADFTTCKRCLGLLTTLLVASPGVAAPTLCPAGCACSEDGLSAVCSGLGEEVPSNVVGSFVSLDLSGHGLQAIDGSTFANLPLLEQLDVSRGRISQVSSDAFQGLRHLRRLVLSDNRLTSLPDDAFPDSLMELRLAGNPLSLPESRPFLRAYGLSLLDLSHCSVSDVGVDAFSQLPSLIELDLRGNRLAKLSPVAFTGLERLYVDEGSLGDSAVAVSQVVTYVVEAARFVATTSPDIKTNQVGSQAAVYDGNPDMTAYSEGALDYNHFRWHHRDEFSPLFGPGSRDVADSSLFKGAPFQATGEVTVVYASDLQNLKETLLVLAGLAVLCFLLAALQRAVENLRGQRARRGLFGGERPRAPDNYWWDAEQLWLEADKSGPWNAELPPPYPHPPSYEDSQGLDQSGQRSVDVQPAVHGRLNPALRTTGDAQ